MDIINILVRQFKTLRTNGFVGGELYVIHARNCEINSRK